jgi:hypothetical protein
MVHLEGGDGPPDRESIVLGGVGEGGLVYGDVHAAAETTPLLVGSFDLIDLGGVCRASRGRRLAYRAGVVDPEGRGCAPHRVDRMRSAPVRL